MTIVQDMLTMYHREELKRSFGLLGMIGFSFSVVTSYVSVLPRLLYDINLLT